MAQSNQQASEINKEQPSKFAVTGLQSAASGSSEYNATEFVVERILNRAATATLVKVQSVTNTPGQVAAIGQVSVLPLVNQLDGDNNSTPHEVVHGLPYFRFQGGSNAVLCDPIVGDIGLAVFCHNDIQNVKSTKAQANPSSRRHFDLADGVYIGLCLSGVPTQYISFSNDGISIVDKNGNRIDMLSSGIKFTTGMNSIFALTHKHSGVQTGSGQSAGPVPGS